MARQADGGVPGGEEGGPRGDGARRHAQVGHVLAGQVERRAAQHPVQLAEGHRGAGQGHRADEGALRGMRPGLQLYGGDESAVADHYVTLEHHHASSDLTDQSIPAVQQFGIRV